MVASDLQEQTGICLRIQANKLPVSAKDRTWEQNWPSQGLDWQADRVFRLNSELALDFFKWALEQGQPDAEQLNYVPLPSSLVTQIEAYWKVGAGM